jgi:hypothetical protein
MALTVIFGLTSSTVLTLIVIPSIYYHVMKGRPQRSDAVANLGEVGAESIPVK